MNSMEIMTIQLADKKISNLETVGFIIHCLGQMYGYPGVDDKLRDRRLFDIAYKAFREMDSALKNNAIKLDLQDLPRAALKDICIAIIDNLVSYEDLEIVMMINKDTAYSQVSKI